MLINWTELNDRSRVLGLGDWSYHKIKLFNSCAFLFQETYLTPHRKTTDKNKQFKGVSTKVGIVLHSVFETCLGNMSTPIEAAWAPLLESNRLLDTELKMAYRLQPNVNNLVARLRGAVQGYNFTVHLEKRLNPLGVLAYVDFIGVTPDGKSALILDYKSYGETPEKDLEVGEQLSLYALCLFLEFPDLTSIKTGCVYIPDETIRYQGVMYRKELPSLEKYWYIKIDSIINTLTEFKGEFPRPEKKGPSCQWCLKEDCIHKQVKKKRKKKEKNLHTGA